MSKYLLKISSDENIYPGYNLGYILGMEKYAICFNCYFNLDSIKKIVKKYPETSFFVALNRVIYEEELIDYKKTLKELDKLNLSGIIVGDLAALTYDLKTPLIIDQLHLNNSYLSINHYHKNNCGVYLTNDITKDEINEIKANTKAILLKQVFGHIHLSTSVRKLITNYLVYFNKGIDNSIHYIKENDKDDEYIIIEESFGTHILTSNVLDLYEEMDNINSDYFVIDTYLIDDVLINDIVNAYVKNDVKSIYKVRKKLNITKGFIDTKTTYKVKHYE